MLHPDEYLQVERFRARELQAEAARHRPVAGRRSPAPPARSEARAWERRLGWLLIETGLRLLAR
ncbi:hypothetical protein [Nonomuraea gerenzanensis]|uniref:Uncharacterized protein n=1 Tax=Nonomuraea gerenzanensis TaxID=93944 RepID=A0A1M4E145_9ACTN|nr:hypothetical protein [Nonomuraea gerenzanensis]UBU14815.1 hypothetical protein LCN96_07245 [Nonomuraea gerenzanensis]SBO92543.1 hypothetical protein BN4615_P2057 [Nonomuraea gerenzanensis]